MTSSAQSDIRILANGGVVLGPDVVCDGFQPTTPFRVQSHVHHDHMNGFASSKGLQKILMSKPTKELLTAELDADLPYRSNVLGVELDTPISLDKSTLTLLSSGHMLGSVQVLVTLADGKRLTYSGDFAWPMDSVAETDVLILDSTYGDPQFVREYDQADVDRCFIETVNEALVGGPVFIKAYRGTLQRAAQLLDDISNVPVIASSALCLELDVYRKFGYSIGDVLDAATPEGEAALREGRFLRLMSKGDPDLFGLKVGTGISLSAFMTTKAEPITHLAENVHRIAMTNHADFDGTLAYVKATGASLVLTDNSKHGSAIMLATEITRRLGIHAESLEPAADRSWGS